MDGTGIDRWQAHGSGDGLGAKVALGVAVATFGGVVNHYFPGVLALAAWPLLGALVGYVWHVSPVLRRRLAVRFDEVSIELPVIGSATIYLTSKQATLLWPVYIELSTRVATRPLSVPTEAGEEPSGSLPAALKSLYDAFQASRAALIALGDTTDELLLAQQRDEEAAAVWVARALNRPLGDLLSRWHPVVDRWVASGVPEARWPFAEELRADLVLAQAELRAFVGELGLALGAPTLSPAVPERGAPRALRLAADTIGFGEDADEAIAAIRTAIACHAPHDTAALIAAIDEALPALAALPTTLGLAPEVEGVPAHPFARAVRLRRSVAADEPGAAQRAWDEERIDWRRAPPR